MDQTQREEMLQDWLAKIDGQRAKALACLTALDKEKRALERDYAARLSKEITRLPELANQTYEQLEGRYKEINTIKETNVSWAEKIFSRILWASVSTIVAGSMASCLFAIPFSLPAAAGIIALTSLGFGVAGFLTIMGFAFFMSQRKDNYAARQNEIRSVQSLMRPPRCAEYQALISRLQTGITRLQRLKDQLLQGAKAANFPVAKSERDAVEVDEESSITIRNRRMKFRVVLTGAACSGKTTTLNALKEKLKDDKSYRFIDEVATRYILEQQKNGVNPFKNLIDFERRVMARQVAEEDTAGEEGTCTILDRSLIDDIAITEMFEVGKNEHIDVLGELEKVAQGRTYNLVFILDPLPFVRSPHRSQKDGAEALKEDHFLRNTYHKYGKERGIEVISVPVMPIEARVDLIVREMKKMQARALQSASAPASRAGLFGTGYTNQPQHPVISTPNVMHQSGIR